MSTHENITVVTERGQTSIPAELRRDMGLAKGQRLLWERVDEHELRVRVVGTERPAGASSVLGFARRFRATRSTQDWMDELREGER